MSHTPGPWHYLDIGEIVPSDEDGLPHEALRICFMATAGSALNAQERIDANARLIAAAPDLLEALQIAMQWIKAWDVGFLFDDDWAVDEAKINAAIAKATEQAK